MTDNNTCCTLSVLLKIHATVFRKNRSIMLVRYTKPSTVTMYVISETLTAFGSSGLNCSFSMFFSFKLKMLQYPTDRAPVFHRRVMYFLHVSSS